LVPEDRERCAVPRGSGIAVAMSTRAITTAVHALTRDEKIDLAAAMRQLHHHIDRFIEPRRSC
jgi:hypothetical protein